MRQGKYAIRNSEYMEFQIGDLFTSNNSCIKVSSRVGGVRWYSYKNICRIY